jgi:hypothetical protein
MKNWNGKLLLLASGLVLLAFIVPGSAQEKKRTDPPVAKGPALRAVSPKLIEIDKGKARAFVPIEMKELIDPVTKKPATKETRLRLHSGEMVPAPRHLAALNQFEEKLVKKGFSLRDKPGTYLVQSVAVDHELLKKQSKAREGVVVKKGSARLQALAASAETLRHEHAEREKAAKKLGKAVIDVGGPLLQPVSTVKTHEDHFGDPSTFGASFKTQLTLKGDTLGTSLAAEGRATGSILGQSKDLLLATASVTTPRSGGLSAKVKVTVLGVDQLVLDKSEPAGWSKSGEFNRTLPDNLRVKYPFELLFIPMSAEVGITGSADLKYFVGLLPGSSTGWMIAEVKSQVYVQFAFDGTVEIFGHDLGAKAGVDAEMTLFDNKLVLAAGIDQGSDAKGKFVKDWYTSRDDLKALAGKLSVFLEVDFFGTHRYAQGFWDFGGFHTVITPFDGGETRYLQPPARSPR